MVMLRLSLRLTCAPSGFSTSAWTTPAALLRQLHILTRYGVITGSDGGRAMQEPAATFPIPRVNGKGAKGPSMNHQLPPPKMLLQISRDATSGAFEVDVGPPRVNEFLGSGGTHGMPCPTKTGLCGRAGSPSLGGQGRDACTLAGVDEGHTTYSISARRRTFEDAGTEQYTLYQISCTLIRTQQNYAMRLPHQSQMHSRWGQKGRLPHGRPIHLVQRSSRIRVTACKRGTSIEGAVLSDGWREADAVDARKKQLGRGGGNLHYRHPRAQTHPNPNKRLSQDVGRRRRVLPQKKSNVLEADGVGSGGEGKALRNQRIREMPTTSKEGKYQPWPHSAGGINPKVMQAHRVEALRDHFMKLCFRRVPNNVKVAGFSSARSCILWKVPLEVTPSLDDPLFE
ncbi:hypothetical protein BDZ91DRAFT_765161 [Kalaharituber pfeilii]|nr:hypothetical protein BDZ91DRAFT_765161 [Kalaharituber pfeilii]